MEQQQNSNLTVFDFILIKSTIKKSVVWIILILILSLLSAFFYNRYTLPAYESSLIFQLNKENQSKSIFNEKDLVSSFDKTKRLVQR